MTQSSTFVLVHGAWAGGWIWQEVAACLRAAGHLVFTPTLTGLGERSHLLSPSVGLDTHAADVANLLHYGDLSGAVLVGHGYAGMVITAAAEKAAGRIDHLCYLDAFVPEHGSNIEEFLPGWLVSALDRSVDAIGEGWKIPPPDDQVLGCPEGDAEFRAKLSFHPYRTMHDRVRLTNPVSATLPRSYVACTRPMVPGRPSLFAQFADRAREAGWQVRELDCCHQPMVANPQAVAETLDSLT